MAAPIPCPSPASDRPDAVRFLRATTGKLSLDAMEAAVELAEEYLQCGPHELAWVRDQVSYLFATRAVEDGEFFPTGHDLAGKPRYRWVDVGEGVEIGWLIDG